MELQVIHIAVLILLSLICLIWNISTELYH